MELTQQDIEKIVQDYITANADKSQFNSMHNHDGQNSQPVSVNNVVGYLKTLTGKVKISGSIAPLAGQVLTAIDDSNASWQGPLVTTDITLDNEAAVAASGGSTQNTSFTVSGSTPLLLVGIATDAAHTPTGVSYNGISLTALGNTTAIAPDNQQVYVYYLRGPATGANILSITLGGGGQSAKAYAVSYNQTNQGVQPDASANSTSLATTHFTQSVTTTVNNCLVVMFGITGSNSTLTPDNNNVITYNSSLLGTSGFYFCHRSSITSAAGSVTLGINSASQNFSGFIISINPL